MSDEDGRQTLKAIRKRANRARNFPADTDPCSRHAYLIAENMVKKGGYPMLSEEPVHCAISIMATVACLWETRAKLAELRAILGEPSKPPDQARRLPPGAEKQDEPQVSIGRTGQ